MGKIAVQLGIGTAVLLLGQSASATLSQDTEQPVAESPDRVSATNRIICRHLPPPVGQRFGRGRQVCATEAQWNEYNREVRSRLEEAFNRSKVQ